MTTTSGPLFDGRAESAASRYVVSMQEDVAQHGVDLVRLRLPAVLRADTGRYEARIHTERQDDDVIVTDTPVIYGPWLEGDGSRDAPKTRFKGYSTFRITSQVLDLATEDIAQHDLDTGGYVREMNV
jgi:hypothetical protein